MLVLSSCHAPGTPVQELCVDSATFMPNTVSRLHRTIVFRGRDQVLLTSHLRENTSWDATQQSQGSWVCTRNLTIETAIRAWAEARWSQAKTTHFHLARIFLTVCKSRQREIRTPTNILGPDGSLCLWKLQFVFMETSKRFGKQTWKKKNPQLTLWRRIYFMESCCCHYWSVAWEFESTLKASPMQARNSGIQGPEAEIQPRLARSRKQISNYTPAC